MTHYLCIDIGGTRIKYAVGTIAGDLTEVASKKTPRDMKGLLATLTEIKEQVPENISGVAISMPGLLDSKTGYAKHGGSLVFIQEMNVREAFESIFDEVPVQIENDGKCAALGEQKYGVLNQVENGIALVLGTGVGGGLIINHQLLRGSQLSAGEFSFIRTNGDSDEAEDYLGMQGSMPMLAYTYSQLKGLEREAVTGESFFEDILAEDEVAVSLLQTYTKRLSKQILNLQTIIDPEVISIGGGVSQQGILFDYLNQHIDAAMNSLPFAIIRPNIRQSALGNKANLLGALSFFIEVENK